MPTFLSLLFYATVLITATSASPSHYLNSLRSLEPQTYVELSRPLPSDLLVPSCSIEVIHHSFSNTINQPPFTIPYSPPLNCPGPWSSVVLQFEAECKGEQYDRISGLWLGGVELLRTSTAQPTESGISWIVRKDITKYSSLLSNENLNFTMMLENIVNDVYTGVYHIKVTLLFYKSKAVIVPFDRKSENTFPAHLIIPVSDDGKRGHWFWIEDGSDLHYTQIRIPKNSCRAVLELYVSFHGDDEFWYSNPPYSYIRSNNLTTTRGNGAYREVIVKMDGEFIGSVFPFPTIFTGGINPLFWEPVVAIGAFNLPTYELDITPFLENLLDEKNHEIGFGVSDGISFWLIDANLHIWLDSASPPVTVEAKSVVHGQASTLSIEREEEFKLLDGVFTIKAERETVVTGWVKSSSGNLTTVFRSKLSLKNSIKFENNGTLKLVKQMIKTETSVDERNEVGVLTSGRNLKRKYPLKVITRTIPGSIDSSKYVLVTNVSHGMKEKYWVGGFSRITNNNQVSHGWMEVKDHDVLSGEATTNQIFSYRDDVVGCYMRSVAAVNGTLVFDNSTTDDCHPLLPATKPAQIVNFVN